MINFHKEHSTINQHPWRRLVWLSVAGGLVLGAAVYYLFLDDYGNNTGCVPLGQDQNINGFVIEAVGGCIGKPAIYLYPTRSEAVNVRVFPKFGFTKTNPTYRQGWNVQATPTGILTDKANGKQYPYLFWEGPGSPSDSPNNGFVIAQENVSEFLTASLLTLNLNEKEISDFKEFWVPKIIGAPYYFFHFYDRKTMDELAPMIISPVPDTIIRVLIDFRPLEQPIVVETQLLVPTVRKGFTVVEWGGMLR